MESVAWKPVLTTVGGTWKGGRGFFRAMAKEKSEPNAIVSLLLSFPGRKILTLEYGMEIFQSY